MASCLPMNQLFGSLPVSIRPVKFGFSSRQTTKKPATLVGDAGFFTNG